MADTIFTICELVKRHTLAMDSHPVNRHSWAMARRYEAIGKRLELLRVAVDPEKKQAAFALSIKCQPNRWNQYEKGDRQITLTIANRLADSFGVTLDWIYRGDISGLPQRLHAKVAA